MTRASEFDFDSTPFFSANEWPAGALSMMQPCVIETLCALRARVPFDHAFRPSPLLAGHIRHDSSSRHSIDGRLSDATDFFVEWRHLWTVLDQAWQLDSIGGLGVYLDTHWAHQSMPMLHIDCRSKRVLWVRYGGTYFYYHNDPVLFFEVLAKQGRLS